jgi:predicted PurR-regulated permease PerM
VIREGSWLRRNSLHLFDMETRPIDISWSALWKILAFAVLVVVLYAGRQILLGLFLAIIIASGIEGIVDYLEARARLPRSVSVILIFLAALVLFILVAYSFIPFLLVELRTIFSGANAASLGSWSFLLNGTHTASSTLSSISKTLFAAGSSPFSLFSTFIGSFGLALAVIISSFYLSLDRDGVEHFIKVVIPPAYEDHALRIYTRSKHLIGSWFRMQLLLSLIMGFLVWGGLAILGVRYAPLIGVLAALFELVPFLGPIVSGAVAIVAAFLTSFTLAVWTLIFFLAAQQFESNVLVPLLSKRAVGLHPVIVIVALLIGAEVGGILGIIISVPVAAVFQEVVQDWSSKRRSRGA